MDSYANSASETFQAITNQMISIKWGKDYHSNNGLTIPLIFPHTTTLIQNVACHLLDSGTDIVEIWIDI